MNLCVSHRSGTKDGWQTSWKVVQLLENPVLRRARRARRSSRRSKERQLPLLPYCPFSFSNRLPLAQWATIAGSKSCTPQKRCMRSALDQKRKCSEGVWGALVARPGNARQPAQAGSARLRNCRCLPGLTTLSTWPKVLEPGELVRFEQGPSSSEPRPRGSGVAVANHDQLFSRDCL